MLPLKIDNILKNSDYAVSVSVKSFKSQTYERITWSIILAFKWTRDISVERIMKNGLIFASKNSEICNSIQYVVNVALWNSESIWTVLH